MPNADAFTDTRIGSYLDKVVVAAKNICGSNLLSVVLFGSAVAGGYVEGVSDIDLMLLLSDKTPDLDLRTLDRELDRIKAVSGPLKNRGRLLKTFARRTALFKSHFILRHSTLKSLDHDLLVREARGFDVPLGRFLVPLAPTGLVLSNVMKGAVVVYGEDLLGTAQIPAQESSSIVQAFVASLAVSVFGAVASLLSSDGTMFSLESVKWFLLDLQSFKHETRGLSEALRGIEAQGPSPILRQFKDLRQKYRWSLPFAFLCPIYLAYIFLRHAREATEEPNQNLSRL